MSAAVTAENGIISIESISMRTAPAAYRPPTLTTGRLQSLNDSVIRPEATRPRSSGLNCIGLRYDRDETHLPVGQASRLLAVSSFAVGVRDLEVRCHDL